MNKMYEPNIFISRKKEAKHEPKDFAVSYDEFIGESTTEYIEAFIRDLAKRFFTAGYEKGQYDERGKPSDSTVVHDTDLDGAGT